MTTITIPAPSVPLPRRAPKVRPVPALTARRLALTVRSPRSLLVPLLPPVLFALVVAPALADSVAPPGHRTAYMTFFCLATAGLLIPLNCMFSGIGVLLDRQQGAMRELLVAPIPRSSIVTGNLVAALGITSLQLVVLIGVSVLRGADYQASARVIWFVAGAALLVAVTYGIAEILSTRLTSVEEYTAALPAVAIVPFFFGGSLYPITALPGWLEAAAKVLPLTHALALFRFGLTSDGGRALHNIWGMSNDVAMAALSLGVLAVYALLATTGAIRLFTRAGRS
jgi:ABC-2 type transport system permease protein